MIGDAEHKVTGKNCPLVLPVSDKVMISISNETPNHPSKPYGSALQHTMTDVERVDSPQSLSTDLKEEALLNDQKVQEDCDKSEEITDAKTSTVDEPVLNGLPETAAETSKENVPTEKLTRDQIKDLVSKNVEFFFSRENWSSDPYLLSQMDSDQYVPVYILANCSQFKSITKDHSIILDALKDSDYVQLDEDKNRVRPNYKRCILMLREIPKSTPVDEVESIFEGDGCPKALSCEFVHNDSWYVTFESDADAQKAYRYLRETVMTFKGKPILARIKTKAVSRLGCLSVLPSYAGKANGELADAGPQGGGKSGSSAPLPPRPLPNVTGSSQGPPPPHSSFTPNNIQRPFVPPSNPVSSPYNGGYNYSGSNPLPTAYFYPNPMMPWAAPNFYDINSFIQYNGLSPRATFKPPTNSKYNSMNNGNRRPKLRDNKHDKMDTKSVISASNSMSARYNQVGSLSLPPHSLHTGHGTVGHQSIAQQSPQSPRVDREFNCDDDSPTGSQGAPNSSVSDAAPKGYEYSHTSQSSDQVLFASSNKEADPNNLLQDAHLKRAKTPGDQAASDRLSSHKSTDESNASISQQANQAQKLPSTTSVSLPPMHVTDGAENAPRSSSHLTSSSSQSRSTQSGSAVHSLHGQTYANNAHRNHYNEAPYESNRNATRGGRRRMPRRDDEYQGGGSRAQRGFPGGQGGDAPFKQGAADHQPSFELKATSFPPLSGEKEEEKGSGSANSGSAWSGPSETQSFSDIMKRASKGKSSIPPSGTIEREPIEQPPEPTSCNQTTVEPVIDKSKSRSSTIVSETSTEVEEPIKLPIVVPDQPSSSSVPPPSISIPVSNSSTTKTGESNQAVPPHSPLSRSQEKPWASKEQQRPLREEVKNVEPKREHQAGIGRGSRRDRESTGSSKAANSNKENRLQGSTQVNRNVKEERVDPDGWITKAPKEPRSQRQSKFQNTQQVNHREMTKNAVNHQPSQNKTPLVNGDINSTSPRLEHNAKSIQNETSPTPLPAKTDQPKVIEKDTTPTPQPPRDLESTSETVSRTSANDGASKTSWAKMALASKDQMERLSTELKEKEEQERQRKKSVKAPIKFNDRPAPPSSGGPKPHRRDQPPGRPDRDGPERNRAESRGQDRFDRPAGPGPKSSPKSECLLVD